MDTNERMLPTLSSDSLLVLDDAIYKVDLFEEGKDFDKDHAYLDGDYFYLYRGEKSKYEMNKPGIYKEEGTGKVVLVEPQTEDEKKYYLSEDKVVNYNPEEIASVINTHEEIFVPVNDSAKLFNPEITVDDDILKRILKTLFIEKEIEIDNYKDRFPDKNALFNFKQVMKNRKSRVTMKIFERACDVVGVEYIITLKEKNNEQSIGKRLDHDIVVSSEDTYDFSSVGSSDVEDDE